MTPALLVFLAMSVSAAQKKKEIRIEDLQPVVDAAVEPAAPARRASRREAPADTEPAAEEPTAPKKGFGRPLKPVRKGLLKPSTLPTPQAASYNKDNATK